MAAGAGGEQQAATGRSHLHDRDARTGHEFVDGLGERLHEHRAGLEDAADQTHREGAGEAGLADHHEDLSGQLAGPVPVELARDRVAARGELRRLRRERGDLALGERLGIHERRHLLDTAASEERTRRRAQRRVRTGRLAVVQRGLDRLDPEPVAAALVPE